MQLNYKKIWKRKTLTAKILAGFISWKREHFNYPIHRFKVKKWYRLINRIQMIGLTKPDVLTILQMRACNHRVKCIKNSTGLTHKKIMAVLYYYDVWKKNNWKNKIGRIILK